MIITMNNTVITTVIITITVITTSPINKSDTTGAPWDEIVNALLSNTEERSKTVTLVFERELPDEEGQKEGEIETAEK